MPGLLPPPTTHHPARPQVLPAVNEFILLSQAPGPWSPHWVTNRLTPPATGPLLTSSCLFPSQQLFLSSVEQMESWLFSQEACPASEGLGVGARQQ